MFCPNCGSNIDDNAVFCSECGTRIGAAAPVPELPVQNPAEQIQPMQAPVVQAAPATEGAEPTGKKKIPGWLTAIIVLLIVAVVGVASAFLVKHFMDDKGDKSKDGKKSEVSGADADDGEGVEINEETTAPRTDVYSESESETYQQLIVLHTKAPATTTQPPEIYETIPPAVSTTRPPTTVPPETPSTPPSYLPVASGFNDSQIESAMEDYIYSNNWSAFSKYILPGSQNIVNDMISIETAEGYGDYLKQGCSDSINEYRSDYASYPDIDSVSYKYYLLDSIDEDYSDNTDYGLYEIVKTVLNKYYGTNIKYKNLVLMETIVIGTDGEDYGFYVFVIETDTGYFFLCN